MTGRLARALAAAAMAWLLCGSPAPAQAADEGWGYALAHELMSPYCPGRTLAACTSEQAGELRQWIVLQEAAGASREEVEAQLYERFGDVLRSAPVAQGWGLTAYVLPAAAGVLGIALVLFVLRRIVRPAGASASVALDAGPALAREDTAELERVIDEELGRA